MSLAEADKSYRLAAKKPLERSEAGLALCHGCSYASRPTTPCSQETKGGAWYRIITKGTSIRGWWHVKPLLLATLATMLAMACMVQQLGACPSPLNISHIQQAWGTAPPTGAPTLTPTPAPTQLTDGRQGELIQLVHVVAI